MLDDLPIDALEANQARAATEHRGLGGRGVLKASLAASTTALATGLAASSAHAASRETSAGNAVSGPTAIRPGVLLKVLDVSGVRAGVLTEAKPGQPVSAARKAFATGDAYADPGYWFFFHEANGLLAAVRVFTAKNSGKQVGNAVMGQRTAMGPQLVSSMGTLVFDRDMPGGQLWCRFMASNYYDAPREMAAGQQQCSPYFVSTRRLKGLRPRQLDDENRSCINEVIRQTVSQLNLAEDAVVYCR